MDVNQAKLKLVSARVTDYGCFHDSDEVPIEDVTALIAENENGKSTFLRALAWWENQETQFDEEDRWDKADPKATLDLVALTFETTKASRTALNEAGVGKPPVRVRITRDSEGDYRVEDADSRELVVPQRGQEKFDVSRDDLVNALRERTETPEALGIADELENAQLGSGIAEGLIPRIIETVIPVLDEPNQVSLRALVHELEVAIAEPGATTDPPSAIDVLDPFIPQILYFDETVDFVQDSVTYAEVTADPSRHRTMVNLATMAGVDLIAVSAETAHSRQRSSRRAEATLSNGFSKYWQGDPVKVFIQLDESQMTLSIEHKGREQRPSRRSSGLKWQLGFFVNFRAEVQGDLSGAVLLLDEPGLHLHIKQQPKLLELFDDLAADGCRIIYATHLPQMLAPDKPHRYRPLIADPKAKDATKVVPNIMALPSKSDVMQPVRQVLGMGIADAIGLGGRNVIAEGWAERYVLLAMSDVCRATQRNALQPTTTVLPAGGSGKKFVPLAAMAVAEKTKAVALVDDDKAGNATVRELDKALPGAIVTVRTHEEDAPTNRELEDLFDPKLFLDLVNASHSSVSGYKAIKMAQIDPHAPICDEVQRLFTATGLGDFQKLRPAMELGKRLELNELPDDKTLDAFSALFRRLNEALA